MKKKAIAFTFLLSSYMTSLPLEAKNAWYFGEKSGWSHFNMFSKNENSDKIPNNTVKNKLSAPILGTFLGYNFNNYLGFEISNDTIGFSPYFIRQTDKNTPQFNTVQILTKFSYPMSKNVKFYTKMGGTAFWDDVLDKNKLKNIFKKDTYIIPSISIGAEYDINDNLFTRIDYTWKNSLKNVLDSSIKTNAGDVVLSLGWKFSFFDNKKDTSLHIDKLADKPYLTLNDSINFPFNSNKIQSSSYEKLNILKNKINTLKLKNVSFLLSGYSDNIGSLDYNQTLSEERAYSVKNYFLSHGFSKNLITIQGMGSFYPITGKTCKKIHNHALLVSCLEPDRRVDIRISGQRN